MCNNILHNLIIKVKFLCWKNNYVLCIINYIYIYNIDYNYINYSNYIMNGVKRLNVDFNYKF